jgi:hypothetical protein
MRVSVSGWNTTARDIDRSVAAVASYASAGDLDHGHFPAPFAGK